MEDKSISEKKVFAKGMCGMKIAVIFILGSLIGTFFEEFLHFVRYGYYETRHGVLYGPFNPLYGAGFVILLLSLYKIKKWPIALIVSILIMGTLEYLICFLQEIFVGSVSWDYSNELLNINGRTTVLHALFFGITGFIFVYILYPYFANLIEKIPYLLGMIIINLIMVFLYLNMLISYSALIRSNMRDSGYEAKTFIGEFFDTYYNDDVLKEAFPNMMFDD